MVKENKECILTDIIMQHVEDTCFGSKREELNFVDVLYPSLERIFGLENCLNAPMDNDLLRTYYEANYDGISFDSLVDTYVNAKETCDQVHDKDKLIEVEKKMSEFSNKVQSYRKSKNNVK